MKDRKRIKRLNPLRAYFPIFVLPTLAAFIIGFLYPFIRGIYLSFCTFRTTSDAKWVGLDNYIKAFNDEGFFHAFFSVEEQGFDIHSILPLQWCLRVRHRRLS